MSRELRKRLVQKMNNLLELKRQIVGVKFYYDEAEYAASPARQLKHKLPYCMTVRVATNGSAVKVRADNIGCFAAARVLGMTEVTESYKSGEDYMAFNMFKNQAASKKVCDNLTINPRTPYGVEISALALMETDPDIVIIVTVPYNIMRIIQGYNYHYGTYNRYKMGGLQAMCSEITATTYVTGEINTSMMCAGTRYLSKWDPSEMAVGIPWAKFENVVDGVYKTVDPLERDRAKKRIVAAFESSGMTPPDVHMGKNYDSDYYEVGTTKI